MVMKGYGKIFRVNLSKEMLSEDLDGGLVNGYLGGKGLERSSC
jgi:hypothetical protein